LRWIWPLLTVVMALIPVRGVFTVSRVFFVRDLLLAFRSRFLFLRQSVASGAWPLWDPYPAHGQPAVAEALSQLFHPLTLAIRLLLPQTVAFNVWIALPVPIAALGAYGFFRRVVTAPAAAAGALAFAAGGPIVSATNAPNLSWSLAAVPFVFWTMDRLVERASRLDVAALACAVACQALAGEPVTLAATAAIATAYAAWAPGRARRWRAFALGCAGLIAGSLLASVQYFPLLAASRHSMRAVETAGGVWALHPLAFVELVAPRFFGDTFNSDLRELSWMLAVNSGREPLLLSMYLGVPVVMAAGLAALSGRPRTLFWTAVVIVCAMVSLGPHTPLYPVLVWALPPLGTLRFPVKYLTIASFGVAALASMAVQWLLDGDVPRRPLRVVLLAACLAGAAAYAVVAWVLIAPRLPIEGAFRAAQWAGVPSPIQGAEFLLYRARPLLTVFFLKAIGCAFLLAMAASVRRERRLALGALLVAGAADLVWANANVNPTLPAAALGTPAWYRQIPADTHERVYVGGRLDGRVDVGDVDAPKYAAPIGGFMPFEQQYLIANEFIFHPSGSRMRESMTYDLPVLWPKEFARAAARFAASDRATRLRFLARVGTRYAVLPSQEGGQSPFSAPLARLAGAEQMALYDFNPGARRAYVVSDALRGPDVDWQIDGLFEPRFDPAAGVLVSETPPPAAGRPGPAAAASATFVEDALNRVVIRAGLPDDGYLALLDSYDADWRVDVDGARAPLMRANGLFRAVHLTRGEHTVTFTYRPSILYAGAGVTAATAVALALWCGAGRPRRHLAAVVARS
jgi:hypothetical protein